MSSSFEVDQGKANRIILGGRKVILNKGQHDIIGKLRGSISAAMIGLNKELIYQILVLSKREWEKENMRQLNDFRFMHVNERIEAFDNIFATFIKKLNDVLITPIDESSTVFMRKNTLTNYKDILETEGYVVSYEI